MVSRLAISVDVKGEGLRSCISRWSLENLQVLLSLAGDHTHQTWGWIA